MPEKNSMAMKKETFFLNQKTIFSHPLILSTKRNQEKE